MKKFRKRVAVITGAANGIGFAMAQRFAKEGMQLVLADIDEEALLHAEKELQAEGATTISVRTDVRVAKDVEQLAVRSLIYYGGVHVICNNAGIAANPGKCWEQTEADWNRILDINLWSVIHGINTFVPILLEQGEEAHIVNTASIAAHVVFPGAAPYSTTKFAILALTETLHHELAMSNVDIGVSVLCPGFVRTNIFNNNRHASEKEAAARLTPEQEGMWDVYEQLIKEGAKPSQVVDALIQGIQEKKLYIFTDQEWVKSAHNRMTEIFNSGNPQLQYPASVESLLGMTPLDEARVG